MEIVIGLAGLRDYPTQCTLPNPVVEEATNVCSSEEIVLYYNGFEKDEDLWNTYAYKGNADKWIDREWTLSNSI